MTETNETTGPWVRSTGVGDDRRIVVDETLERQAGVMAGLAVAERADEAEQLEGNRGSEPADAPPPLSDERLAEIEQLLAVLDNPAPEESWTHWEDLDSRLLGETIARLRKPFAELLAEVKRLRGGR